MIVGANAGLVGMAKEHLGVALALRVPVFFLVTKTDLAPEHVTRATLTVRGRGAPRMGAAGSGSGRDAYHRQGRPSGTPGLASASGLVPLRPKRG
jgi:hypothetical protein